MERMLVVPGLAGAIVQDEAIVFPEVFMAKNSPRGRVTPCPLNSGAIAYSIFAPKPWIEIHDW